MATVIRNNPAKRSKRSKRQFLHKAHGLIGPRVQAVGGERFALVCVDPAKGASEWMMADYYGRFLIEPRRVEHVRGQFAAALALLQEAVRAHDIQDLIVTVERTGSYHLSVQRAFAGAGYETRVVHPCATQSHRRAADPGLKTDPNDLFAQHRAAVAGLSLVEPALDENARRLQLWSRHRRDQVQKASALRCQIREHLHLALPGFAESVADLFGSDAMLAVVRACATPQEVLAPGADGWTRRLATLGLRCQERTLEKLLAWARQAPAPDPDATVHQRIARALEEDRQAKEREIQAVEREIVAGLVQTPYVLLLMIPGIHVVSAGDLAAEMGPIAHYANANAITGRAGLFPMRYQSGPVDRADGPLARHGNRRLRTALLRIADNLVKCNHYFMAEAELARLRGCDARRLRVRAAKRFTRLAYVLLAGRELKHPCCRRRESVLRKLGNFHREHGTPLDRVLADMQRAVEQFPQSVCAYETVSLQEELTKTQRRRQPSLLGELLPAVLARLLARCPEPSSTPQAEPSREPVPEASPCGA